MTARLATWLLAATLVWGATNGAWRAWAVTIAELSDFQRQNAPAPPAPAAPIPRQTLGLNAPDPVVQVLMSQIISPTLRHYVGDLSGEWPAIVSGEPYTITTRLTDSGEPIAKAVQWASEHLASLGLEVSEHVWQTDRPPNVIAELAGSTAPQDVVILSAHLDSISGEAVAPGADDNASGVAGVLAAADVLSAYTDAWRCTLRFALWTGEEQGLLGSREYARQAAEASAPIRGVLNLDMIGWNTPGSSPDIDLHATAALPASIEMAQLFAAVVGVYDLDLTPQIITTGIRGSDHASFWDNGYPAILAIEDYYSPTRDFNPYYHTTQDRLEKLDMAYFTAMAQAAVGAFVHWSDCLATGVLGGHAAWSESGQPVSGATITAVNPASHTFTTRVDAAGVYSLTLPAGTYEVTITPTTPNAPPVAVESLVISADALTTQNFTLSCAGQGSIGGVVWLDDGNGQPDPVEPGLSGAPLHLAEAGPDALLDTADDVDHGAALTDLAGNYSFSCLPPGAYRVEIDPANPTPGMAGLVLVHPDGSGRIDLPLAAGEIYNAANFGFRSTTAVQVLSFQARPRLDAVELTWQVLLESARALRLHVLRFEADSAGWQQVTESWVEPIATDGPIARFEFVDHIEPGLGSAGAILQYALRDEDGVFYGPWLVHPVNRRLFLPVILHR